jgi:hypothetical protein
MGGDIIELMKRNRRIKRCFNLRKLFKNLFVKIMINQDNHSQNNVAKQETLILFKLYSLV